MPRAARLLAALAAGALLGSCRSGDTPCAAPSTGETPLHRLSRFEYDNTVRDLLGDDSHPADAFPADAAPYGFDNANGGPDVTELPAEQYLRVAEQVAGRAVKHLPALLGCDPAVTGEDACARQFFRTFGRRAFRRPLDAAQEKRLVDLYAWGRGTYGFATGIQVALEAMLASPRFLYRVEIGTPDPDAPGVAGLDGWEIAARLSYLLWASTPDDALLDAAEGGRLGTPAEIAAQAARMLEDPRARASVARFHAAWLGIDHMQDLSKDTNVYPTYRDALRPLWQQETLSFLERVVFDEHGGLEEMLTAPWSMMNADLAAFYGVTAPPAGSAFTRVDLDPTRRAGFLTHASLLAVYAKPDQSSPVHRGKLVRERLLCEILPAPPVTMVISPPPIDPHATTREAFAEHTANPYCASCHQYMDDVGFGFEHYDGVGLWRDEDHGQPVDARGEVVASRDADGTFDGVPALARRLARSQEVRDCLVTQWFRFAYGRAATDADACSVSTLSGALAEGGIEHLLVALTQTDAFRYRKTTAPGG